VVGARPLVARDADPLLCQLGVAALDFLVRQVHEREQARIHHDRRDQLRAGLEQIDLVRLERAALDGLDHEHADRHAAHEQGHRHERGEPLLARLREVFVVRVVLGVVADHGRTSQRRETDQPLAERELHAPDRLAVEAVGRGQGQTREVGLDQIDRAGVCVEPLADEIDHVAERLVQIVRARDDLGDVREECDAIRNGSPLGRAPGLTAQTDPRMVPPGPVRWPSLARGSLRETCGAGGRGAESG
jgi:hypothetical protein